MEYNLENRPFKSCFKHNNAIIESFDKWFEGSKEEIKEDIIRLLQFRAGSIYPLSFEAGVVYGYLRILGKQPALIVRDDVDDFIDLICSFRTKEDAEEKLKEILGEE